jgi:hypothetical protein
MVRTFLPPAAASLSLIWMASACAQELAPQPYLAPIGGSLTTRNERFATMAPVIGERAIS